LDFENFAMSEDLDNKLRNALRPVDPGEDFTARVLARVAAEEGRSSLDETRITPQTRAVGIRSGRFWQWVGSLAATFAVAAVVAYQWKAHRERAGLEAREQVLEALRVTSEKLDIAYQIVNSTPPAGDETQS
jgi:negative regulator of sigma E activity